MQVRKLLQSSEPTAIHIKNASTVADAELSNLQQKRLMALAVRTMALPTGRAALTLGEPLSEIGRLRLHAASSPFLFPLLQNDIQSTYRLANRASCWPFGCGLCALTGEREVVLSQGR